MIKLTAVASLALPISIRVLLLSSDAFGTCNNGGILGSGIPRPSSVAYFAITYCLVWTLKLETNPKNLIPFCTRVLGDLECCYFRI